MGVAIADGAAKRAYLVWDADFGHRFLLSLACFAGLGYCGLHVEAVHRFAWDTYQEVLFRLMEGAHRMAWWSAIGLLSSSCCALQLMLNALNFGCAGFNTVLGPVRPALCALTVCIQAAVWYTAAGKRFQWLYVAPCTLLAAVLTLLPELTALWLQRRATATRPRHAEGRSQAVFSISGMGCIACTKKVTDILDSFPQVVEREVQLEKKQACVSFSVGEDEAKSKCVPEVLRLIKEAGFEAELSTTSAAPSKEASSAKSDDASKSAVEGPLGACGGCAAGLPLSIGAGLLSSSCCLLQLGVNLLAAFNVAHVGCAGFNKVLGPWRTPLRLLTASWLLGSWGLCWRGAWPRRFMRRLALQTLLCLLLTFLPEALLYFGGPAVAPSAEGAEVIRLKVDGMGCEACQVHVQGVMDRAGGVLSSTVDFQAGHAELVVNRDWAFDLNDMVQQLEKDGYNASLRDDL